MNNLMRAVLAWYGGEFKDHSVATANVKEASRNSLPGIPSDIAALSF
jgi:hypothetical protein